MLHCYSSMKRTVTFVKQGMLSSCFLISSDKNLLGSINKKHLVLISLFLKIFKNTRELVKHFFADTDIRNRCDLLRVIRLAYKLSNGRNNCRRKVIGAEIAEILLSVNNGRFTCA